MVTAGYSGTPLLKKLGIKPSTKLLLINAPGDYEKLLNENISNLLVKKTQTPDLVHLFVKDNKQFESEMKKLKPLIKKNSSIIIWVSWYKKSAKILTDMTEDIIRNYALANSLVDVKVCAVSDIWSGLKLVVPIKYREVSKSGSREVGKNPP
jgi:hypothetical protein